MAPYDNYDYPSYWKGREYEHAAEVNAISEFLKLITKVNTICDIGAGYGRLTPHYIYRAKKTILVDPSIQLLKIARKKLNYKNIKFIHSKLENLGSKIRKNSVDLAIFIRVLHHIKDIDKALSAIQKMVKKNGYIILEFPNKCHLKATLSEFFKGNLMYVAEIFPKDRRSRYSKKNKSIPFSNYHPDQIYEKLKSLGFSVMQTRSVSNFRSRRVKNFFGKDFLLSIEKITQRLLARISFGPSIFVLAQYTR